MSNSWNDIKTTVRTNIAIGSDRLQTVSQWAKIGYVAIDNTCGRELWTNCYHSKKYLYLFEDEVRPMTDAELEKYRSDFNEQKRQYNIERKNKIEIKALREEKEKNFEYFLTISKFEIYKKLYESLISEQIRNSDKFLRIVIDTETTGLDPNTDEILQLSIVDADTGETLYDKYFKPEKATEWLEAMYVNGITPETVENAPFITNFLNEIQPFFSQAKEIIGYNIVFDIAFLESAGILVPRGDTQIIDVMREFADIYSEWNDYYGNYKFQTLTTCAEYYGYNWQSHKAHDSLADCRATLFCYNQIRKI